MSYINVSARTNEGDAPGKPIPTKKALREALSQDPESVAFYSTSTMGPQHSGTVGLLHPGDALTVCGPDPYNRRDWWANIKRGEHGKIYMDDKLIKPATN